MGFGLVIGFIELLQNHDYNYKVFANLRTLQFTRTRTEVCSASCIFTSFLVTASNGECSPLSGFLNCPLPQQRSSNSNSSKQLNCSSPITMSLTHQPTLLTPLTNAHRLSCLKHFSTYRTENTIPLLFAGRCLATAAVQSPISRSQPSNESTCRNMLLLCV
jgi:hypothetical protein